MPDAVEILDGRVTRLEEAISNGLARIEDLLRTSITDLKGEQIKDLKDSYTRLADDQRRIWDAIRELEKHRDTTAGGQRVWNSIWNVGSAALGGSGVAIASWLAGKH